MRISEIIFLIIVLSVALYAMIIFIAARRKHNQATQMVHDADLRHYRDEAHLIDLQERQICPTRVDIIRGEASHILNDDVEGVNSQTCHTAIEHLRDQIAEYVVIHRHYDPESHRLTYTATLNIVKPSSSVQHKTSRAHMAQNTVDMAQ